MYTQIASDTLRAGDNHSATRIIRAMKTTWQERAKARMRDLKITQDQLIKVFEVTTRGAVGHYLNNRRTPSPAQMMRLASRLNMSVDELLGGASADDVSQKPTKRQAIHAYEVREYTEDGDLDADREVLVDEVDILLGAGDGVQVPEFVETKFRMPYQSAWFRKHHAKPENVKLMRVHGDSMEPLLFDGDRVAVHLKDQRIVDGRVYAMIYGTDSYGRVKKLYRAGAGLRIVSENTDKVRFPDELVGADDMQHVYIVGRVIDKSGSGGL
jgi:phage repressor protein C with HTH and peptisase S24 domain